MKKILKCSFLVIIFAAIALSIIGLINKEWETLTASISLIIAIISAWIAFETFYQQSLSERPQIILRTDSNSRYGLILLVAENLGSKPAFNIKFIWNQDLFNYKDEKVIFNKYDSDVEIPVLNPKEKTSVIIGSFSGFYEKNRDVNLDYDGIIKFNESLYSKKVTSYAFNFSLRHYGLSPTFEDELPKTLHDLQKLPEKLENIRQVLSSLKIDNDSNK